MLPGLKQRLLRQVLGYATIAYERRAETHKPRPFAPQRVMELGVRQLTCQCHSLLIQMPRARPE